MKTVKELTHLCNSCLYDFPTCDGNDITFGCDIDPQTVDAEADKVIQCDAYLNKDMHDMESEEE